MMAKAETCIQAFDDILLDHANMDAKFCPVRCEQTITDYLLGIDRKHGNQTFRNKYNGNAQLTQGIFPDFLTWGVCQSFELDSRSDLT